VSDKKRKCRMGLYRFFLPVPEFLQDFSRYPNQLPVWFRFLQTRIAWINRGLRPLFTPGIKTNIHHFPVHPAYVPGTLSKSLLLDSLMLYLWSLFLLPTYYKILKTKSFFKKCFGGCVFQNSPILFVNLQNLGNQN